MKVTVAVPSYNSEKFLWEAIESIFAQSVEVDKILIVDDCSADKSFEIALEISEKHQHVDAYKNKCNLGYAKNWNRCLEIASNNYVLLLHSDDILKPNAIQKLLYFFEVHPELAVVGGQEDYFDDVNQNHQFSKEKDDRIFDQGEIYEFIREQQSYIPCSTVMFNMSKIREIGFFQEDVLAADELYWPKILQFFPIAVLGVSLINRRRHAEQAEYKDFKDKKEKIIGWATHFLKILEYEKRDNKKKSLSILMKKKIAFSFINISGSVVKYHHSLRLSLYYVYNSIKYYPRILFGLYFWRSIIKSVLVYFKFLL